MGKGSSSYLKSTVFSTLIEASIVFLILSAALILQFKSRNILASDVLQSIFEKTFFLSISYILVFKLAKRGVFVIVDFAFHKLRPYEYQPYKFWNFLTDIFATLGVILATVPVRPILQKVNLQGTSPVFDQALVKFDAWQSVIILAIVGVPMIICSLKMFEGSAKTLNILGVLGAIVIVGILNNKPNYEARVYETRADWITQNWEKQEEDAKRTLENAKTDKEKAVAYYWLGVAAGRQGRYQENIDFQMKAVELDPTYGAPYSSMSLMYLALHDLEKAGTNAQKCIELDPKYAWCYYAMAGYLDNSGDKKGALINLEKALTLDPNNLEFKKDLENFKLRNQDVI